MRGDPRVDPKKRYRPNRRFSVALPFSYFCDSEENRGSSGNFELEENQCVHSGSTFPDGNTECNSTGIAPSGLGRFVRLEGRLPSRADSPSVQETAGFQVSRQDLRVQGLAVRPKRLSVGLFKASCYGNSTPSPAGHPHILLSGRLAHRRRVSIGPSVTSSNHSSVGSESGVHCQSKEVGVYPSEDARLPRSFSRYPQVNCASGRTQSFGSSVAHPGTRRVSDGSCPPVAESSRTFGQPCGSGSKLQASHAASSVALPSILYPSVRLSVEADSDVSRNQGSVCSLGVSGSSPRRETVLPTPPLPGTDLRCFPVRLGRDSSASPSLRHVVPGGFLGPHQFSRTQGSIPGLEVSRRSCCRSVTSDSFRQHNSRVLHQLSGRNSLPLSLPVSYRAVGVVHSEGDLPFGRSHSGVRQPGGGLPVQREVPSIGVDSQSFDFSSDLSGDCPSAGDRPVCVHPQFSASQVLCPLPGSSSLESGRTLLPVVRPSTVRLPTLFDPPHSLGEDRPGGSGRGSGGPLLASETMVPEVVIASGGTSQSSSSVEGPCLPTHVSSSASETRKPPSHTLAAFREKGKQAGLSDRAAEFTAEALRESTRASYDSKLELFFKWCNDFTCDPYSASLGLVADFLIFLFDKGLAISTIRGYRSAIASCHRGFQDGSSISESSILSNLCKSFFLKRPPEKTLLPAWSLPVVLRALAEAPFEPLHKVSLHCLAIKTAFLVAIASGQRVSALHALSIEPGHVRWEPAGVRLVPRPNFIAKNQSPSSQPVEIFLPSMSSFSSVEADKVWCPVRALKWYLDRTKSKRSSTSLFVSSIAPFKAISKASISRWLVECISMAGPDALVSGRFRAHDTRSVSSSWALFNGASLKDFQQAAYWSSPNTFISCYLKDVLAAEASFGSAVLRSSSGSRSTSTASRVPVVSM